jgi:hypothetical protein
MGARGFTSLPIADDAAVGDWAIMLVVTLLLIALPTIYLLATISSGGGRR